MLRLVVAPIVSRHVRLGGQMALNFKTFEVKKPLLRNEVRVKMSYYFAYTDVYETIKEVQHTTKHQKIKFHEFVLFMKALTNRMDSWTAYKQIHILNNTDLLRYYHECGIPREEAGHYYRSDYGAFEDKSPHVQLLRNIIQERNRREYIVYDQLPKLLRQFCL